MKTVTERILLLFWSIIAALQLLFSALPASATSAVNLNNDGCKISPFAQSHRVNSARPTELPRERPAASVRKASCGRQIVVQSDLSNSGLALMLLGPESETLNLSSIPKGYQGVPGAMWQGEDLSEDPYATGNAYAKAEQLELDLPGSYSVNASASVAGQQLPAVTVTASQPTGDFYTTVYQTQLDPASYPGVSRAAHFQEANENLLQAMEADPQFAQMMQEAGVKFGKNAHRFGSTYPTGWVDLAPRRGSWGHAVGSAFGAHAWQRFLGYASPEWSRRIFDLGKAMTLIEVVRKLESFDEESTIYVAEPWNETSPAIVEAEPETGGLPTNAQLAGMKYFLEIFIARDFLEGWRKSLGTEPTVLEACTRLIQYATLDA
jgi:hypothetical protein